ncbi:HTH-type transcriptional regulator [Wolffia australiana]
MGGCGSKQVKWSGMAAMIIAEDGRLMEITSPIKASQILSISPESIICDADEMDFEDFVREIGDEEEIRPGQIYFILPRSMLQRRLRPETMLELAVKASAALVKKGCSEEFRFCFEEQKKVDRRMGLGKNLSSRLGAIPELVDGDWSL